MFRKPLIIIAFLLSMYVVLDYFNIARISKYKEYKPIWNNDCNHGIHYRGKCICPALYSGDYCEIGTTLQVFHINKLDNCSSRVEYQLYEAWNNEPKEKPTQCPYPIESLHCNRDAITQKDAIKKYTINGFFLLVFFFVTNKRFFE